MVITSKASLSAYDPWMMFTSSVPFPFKTKGSNDKLKKEYYLLKTIILGRKIRSWSVFQQKHF